MLVQILDSRAEHRDDSVVWRGQQQHYVATASRILLKLLEYVPLQFLVCPGAGNGCLEPGCYSQHNVTIWLEQHRQAMLRFAAQ